jgi:hypothetical protein
MSTFTLDDIVAAADKKYANVVIPFGDGDSVTLLNALRLKKEKRSELIELQDALGEDDADQVELLSNGIRTVASDEAAAERLLEKVNGDLAVLAVLFEKYTEGTQAGEA